MDILTFYGELKQLTDKARDSNDPAVMRAFIVLRVLRATIVGADIDSLNALVTVAGNMAERAIVESQQAPS